MTAERVEAQGEAREPGAKHAAAAATAAPAVSTNSAAESLQRRARHHHQQQWHVQCPAQRSALRPGAAARHLAGRCTGMGHILDAIAQHAPQLAASSRPVATSILPMTSPEQVAVWERLDDVIMVRPAGLQQRHARALHGGVHCDAAACALCRALCSRLGRALAWSLACLLLRRHALLLSLSDGGVSLRPRLAGRQQQQRAGGGRGRQRRRLEGRPDC